MKSQPRSIARSILHRFKQCERIFDGNTAIFVETFIEVLADDANAQSLERLVEAGDVIWHRLIDRRGIAFVKPGHDTEQNRRIGGTASNDTRLIEG